MILEKYYISFTDGEKEKSDSDRFVLGGAKNIDKTSGTKSWKFNGTSRLYFHFKASAGKAYNLAIHLATTLKEIPNPDLKIAIYLNTELVQTFENPYNSTELYMVTLHSDELNASDINTISIDVAYNSGPALFIEYAVIEEVYSLNAVAAETSNALGEHDRPADDSVWMKAVWDHTPLTSISIPGTHDSCAIRKSRIRSAYSCQDHTITEQLEGGIRFLDVRVGLKGRDIHDIITCHGSGIIRGEYQKLYTVFDEVSSFLSWHPSECVVMTLKIEDWIDYSGNHEAGLNLLRELMRNYHMFYISKSRPTLGQVRGKVYLINRINDTLDFGVPISIPDNTEGKLLAPTSNREFKVYVQDKYQYGFMPLSPTAKKWECVKNTIDLRVREFNRSASTENDMYLCYCNGFKIGLSGLGIYVMKNIIDYLGKDLPNHGRPYFAPWLILDYPFWKYFARPYGYMSVVDAIIDLNFAIYDHKFKNRYFCLEYFDL